MKFEIEIPDDDLRKTLSAIWFASRQREKLDSDHQELLFKVGKQIRAQELEAKFGIRPVANAFSPADPEVGADGMGEVG